MSTLVDRTAVDPQTAVRVPRRSRSRAGRRAGVTGVVVVGLLCTLAPLYWMLSTSFKNSLEAGSIKPSLWPHHVNGSNYGDLFAGSTHFGTYFVNSLVSSAVAAVLAVAIATLAGYSFSRVKYRLRGAVSVVVLATQMLPLVVLIGPLYLLLVKLHLVDSMIGLVLGYTSFALPFAAWMMKGFIDAIPVEIEEAAQVDGYKPFGTLVRVVAPMCIPGLLTTGAFVFISAWNNLLYPITLTSSQNKLTLPAGLLQSYTGVYKTDWGGMMAASCVTSIPLLIAFFAVQRFMVRGITAGAVAGT